MLEMYLRQPVFTNRACRPLQENKETIKEFKETENSRYINYNQLDKACFQRDMACRDFKDLARRTASDKILLVKAFNIAKNPKYDGLKRS